MNLIKPKRLQEGDTIGIIAPSGEIDRDKITCAVKYFNQKGYKVKLGSNINCTNKYMAGSDNERLEDLHNAFLDKDINAIICARGGYGALRLINKIDFSIIKNNPKIFCGYSDITVLNAMFLKNCGLITFSGPMAQGDFGTEINSYTENSLFETVTENFIKIKSNQCINVNSKDVSGILFGGNLATLTSLCGIDFIPDEKFIFFTEDIGEPAYKIDRYFTQLLNIDKFRNNLAAIVCGEFTDIDNKKWLQDLLLELRKELNIPVAEEFPISHSKTKATIPYGAAASLKNNTLTVSNYLLDN